MFQQLNKIHSNKKSNIINLTIDETTSKNDISIAKVNENYEIKKDDYIILVDTIKKITITLPDIKEKKIFIIKDVKNASKHNINIKCANSSAKIDDAKSILINSEFESITVCNDGINYYIL